MRYKPAHIAILGLFICIGLPILLNAQHAVDFGFSAFTPVEVGENNLGNEINITYQYRFLNEGDKLFIFTSINTFYQPRRWAGETILPSNSDGPGRARYGAGFLLGIYKSDTLFDTEIGFGLSQHILKKRNFHTVHPGFPLSAHSHIKTLPQNFLTFDFSFALSREIAHSIYIKGILKMQSAFTNSVNNTYIRPGISLGYNF